MSKPSDAEQRAKKKLAEVEEQLRRLESLITRLDEQATETRSFAADLAIKRADLLYIIHGDKPARQKTPPADPTGSSTESQPEQAPPRTRRPYTRKKKGRTEPTKEYLCPHCGWTSDNVPDKGKCPDCGREVKSRSQLQVEVVVKPKET